MSTPSINYTDAIQVFYNVQNKENIYISHSLTTTNDQKDSATFEEISTLAQIAINGLKHHITNQSESPEKLRSQAIVLRNYLIKVKDNPDVQENTHRIFLDLFVEVEAEIKQLSEIDAYIHEQDLEFISDEELSEISKDEECHLKFQKYGIRDEETKIRLAKLAVEQRGAQVLEFIQNWGIKNQNALIEIGKLTASKDGWGNSLFILNLGIKDQAAMIEIAKLSAQQNGEMTSKHIKNFLIENEAAMIEIAKLAVQQNVKGTSEHIQNYGIKNRKALIEIAKIAAQKDGEGISRYIQNYGFGNKGFLFETSQWAIRKIGWETPHSHHVQSEGINDQEALILIAKLAARQNAEMTSRYIKNYGIKDQGALFEILQLAARENQPGTFKYIQNFGIKDKDALVAFVKLLIPKTRQGIGKYIRNFAIENEKDLIEIAKIEVQFNQEFSFHIKNYGIKNQKALIEIAKLAADWYGISTHIQNYGIKEEDARIEIAKLAVKKNVDMLSRNLKNYGIKNQNALIEIANIGAQQSLKSVTEYIQNYGIKDEKALIELAKLSARRDGLITSRDIKHCGIKNQKALIEIAKIAAHGDGKGTSEYIENYGIKSPEALIEIAKLAVRNNGWSFLHIQNYGIKDPQTLIEIAKQAAQSGIGISENIQDYGIEDQETLIEIAKLAAQASGRRTSIHIKNYGIKDQGALIEIAKLAARQDGSGATVYIDRYGINNQEALIEIAKLAAQQHGWDTSQYIQNYGIKDQNALVEIAKLAAQQNSGQTSKYIQNYGIKDRKALFEIAKIATSQHPEATTDYFENYGIEEQDQLIEIAKLFAQLVPGKISLNIHRYGIENQEVLIEIAKQAASQDGGLTSRLIKNYGIKDQDALIEIAKLAASQDGPSTSMYFYRYDIKNEAECLAIFFNAFKNNPESLQFVEFYKLNFPKEVAALSKNSTLDDLQKAFRWPEEFSPIFKAFGKEAPKKEDISFLIYAGCRLLKKSPFIKDSNILNSIFHYKDDKMRYELLDMLFSLDEKQAKIYGEFTSPEYLQLPGLFLCYSSNNAEEALSYHSILKEKREFRDGILQKALLDTLQLLIIQHHFKPEEIIPLLKKALTRNIKTNLYGIQGTLYCGGLDRLRKEALNENPDLDAAYHFAFAQTIPIKQIKDFTTKYDQTLGKSALPTAPLTYAGRLKKLSKPEQDMALPALASFIYSVLQGEYSEIRYKRKEASLEEAETKEFAQLDHLQMIFDKKPSLKKEWRDEIKKSLEEYLPTTSTKAAFDPQRFLMEKILTDKHLPKEKYPLLYQFLETKDPKIPKDLGAELEKLKEINKKRKSQVVILRNAISSLGDIEKKNAKDKSVKLLDCLIKLKAQLKGFPIIEESLNGIEELAKLVKVIKQPKMSEGTIILGGIEETDFTAQENAKGVQMFVDQFKKAAEETRSRLEVVGEEDQRLLLQKDLIDLYRNEKATLSQQLGQLSKIHEKLKKGGEEFLNDVKGVVETLGKQKQPFDGYTLVNTDRFDFMLLCGTQVQGSCQRIDGDPNLNKCLLAYLMDGKNRLIAIQDKEEKIVARSILRLLWDTKNNRPVLMQERVYSNVLDPNLNAALDKFAKAESERLGIALYRPDETGTASLESFGSVAPWEYVDSANGVHANGKFTITKATEVLV